MLKFTKEELVAKLRDCFDRQEAAMAAAEQAIRDAEAIDAVAVEASYDVPALVEKAYFK
jgi:hypothetical protein